MVFSRTVSGTCPKNVFCSYIANYSEEIVVLLLLIGFIFAVTLIPALFSWKKKIKTDGKKRICFGVFACFTFYLWFTLLVLNSIFCFGFLAHKGPCLNDTLTTTTDTSKGTTTVGGSSSSTITTAPSLNLSDTHNSSDPLAEALYWPFDNVKQNESCQESNNPPISQEVTELRNVTLMNILIILVLIVILVANAKEGKSSYYFLNWLSLKLCKQKLS